MTNTDYVLYGFELNVEEKEILGKWIKDNFEWMEANYKVFHWDEHEVLTGGLIAARSNHRFYEEDWELRSEGKNYRGIGVLLTDDGDARTFSFSIEDFALAKLEEKLAPHLELIAKIFGPTFVQKPRRIIFDSYDPELEEH